MLRIFLARTIMPKLRKTELVRRPLSWNDLCNRFKNLVKQSSKGSFGTTERIDVFLTRSCVYDWYFLWGCVRSNLSKPCSVPKLLLCALTRDGVCCSECKLSSENRSHRRKGIDTYVKKWCVFLSSFLLEVTWVFWKMWTHITAAVDMVCWY